MAIPTLSLTENPLSPDSRKDEKSFGLKVLRQCYARWKNGYGGETYSERLMRYEKNRLYAMGKQPMEQYQDIVKVDGRIPVVNLVNLPLAIAPPLLNAKLDRYMERNEEIRCKASGPVIEGKRKQQRDEAKFKLNYGEAIKNLQQNSGLQLEEFSDTDPKSARELDIQFKTSKKVKEELIMQMGIDKVFKQNNWPTEVKPKLIWDVFNCGFGVTLTELNGNGWIKTPRVKPEAFITSYSEMDNFEDWQWQGQRRSMAISEIRLRYDVNEEELFNLAIKFRGSYGNPVDWYAEWSDDFITALARPYDGINVEVVDLYYKTLYNLSYAEVTNKVGRVNLIEPEKLNGKERITGTTKSKPYYVAYHGVWIIDTDYVLEWGLAKNMLKPNNNLGEIRSPYSIHMFNNNKCRNTPLTETMIPLIDLIQNIHMQTLKLIAMVAPDGFNVDVLGLANMDLGQGVGVVSPMQAFDIYLQTGTQYFMGRNTDDPNAPEQKPPITPNNHPYGNKLEQLDGQFWSAYKKLQIITGDNNLASGIITNQATANSTLEDAREIAAEPSNYVHKSVINVQTSTAKNIELLLLDKFFLIDDSFSGYSNLLGEDDIKYMRDMGETLADIVFETEITVANADADKARWDRFIEIALEQGQITPADVAKLDLIEDQTYRSFLFAQAVEDKKASDMQIAQANSENNVKQAQAAAQMKSQGDMQLEQMQHQNKLDQMSKQQDMDTSKQANEFSGIVKAKAVEAILGQPGAKIEDLPAFLWAGLGITEEAQKQVLLQALQRNGQQQQQEAMEQQAAAQQAQQQQGEPVAA